MGEFHLQILKKNEEEMREFAESLIHLVKEMDKHTVEDEIEKIRGFYHIDHYFILQDERKIGVVKIFQGTFYYLGIEEGYDTDAVSQIITKIEEYLGGWRVSRLDAQIRDIYLPAMQKLGYTVEFGRYKMSLDLSRVTNMQHGEGIRTYQEADMPILIDMVTDAYRNSKDEKVGIFKPGMASTELPNIVNGKFGRFRPDLTSVFTSQDPDYIEGACLVSITENQPFVVLIGVRRSAQGNGIGRKLMSWVVDRVIEAGYQEIKLWVTSGNEAAEQLYKSMGFETISSIYHMYRSL